jgi:hypothetical protein
MATQDKDNKTQRRKQTIKMSYTEQLKYGVNTGAREGQQFLSLIRQSMY